MKSNTTCSYCNTEMKIDLEGFTVNRIGGKEGEKKSFSHMIEMFPTKLCSCPFCGKKEKIIEEDPKWISLEECGTLIAEGRIVSNNPEIELILTILGLHLSNK